MIRQEYKIGEYSRASWEGESLNDIGTVRHRICDNDGYLRWEHTSQAYNNDFVRDMEALRELKYVKEIKQGRWGT